MKFNYIDHVHSDCTPTGLRITEDQYFKWDGASNNSVVIIKTPYRKNVSEYVGKICNFLGDVNDLPPGEEIPVSLEDQLSIYYVPRYCRCRIGKMGYRYTVLYCEVLEDVINVYAPTIENAMTKPYIDLLLDVTINLRKITKKKGLLGKKTEDTGFYCLTLPMNLYDNDHLLSIKIKADNDFLIPITAEMVKQRSIYLKTDRRPEVVLIGDTPNITLNIQGD